MMIKKTKTIAYPGIPIIFAEGFKNYEDRISYHNSVGLALTDLSGKVRTETTVGASDQEITFLLNNKAITGKRAEGMLKIVTEMMKTANYNGGLKISSYNYDILSGSSDSGAAALVVALNDLFGLKLSLEELLKIAHYGSETVFRSLYGGLTEYSAGELRAKRLAKNLQISIFALSFKSERFSADKLHLAVVKHPEYKKRARGIDQKIAELKDCLKAEDTVGLLSLMESDANDVHKMFRETGQGVIKPEMRKLCNFVENLRKEKLNTYWNIAGGSCVYVFCPTEDKEKVRKELNRWKLLEYKIAGGVEISSS